MSNTQETLQDDRTSQRQERRVLILATSLGFFLFLVAYLFVPSVGPVIRIFNVPSGSMLPTLQVGSYLVVSRASYGYSRYSFDDFELPITGRWPALMPQRETSSCSVSLATARPNTSSALSGFLATASR
jgi:signal peptidase I